MIIESSREEEHSLRESIVTAIAGDIWDQGGPVSIQVNSIKCNVNRFVALAVSKQPPPLMTPLLCCMDHNWMVLWLYPPPNQRCPAHPRIDICLQLSLGHLFLSVQVSIVVISEWCCHFFSYSTYEETKPLRYSSERLPFLSFPNQCSLVAFIGSDFGGLSSSERLLLILAPMYSLHWGCLSNAVLVRTRDQYLPS